MTSRTVQENVEALLPSYIQDWLHSCPTAGTGVNLWLVKVATRLHCFFQDKSRIAELLEKHSAGCGREVSTNEIWRAIHSSERWLGEQKSEPVKRPLQPSTVKPSTVEPNQELIRSLVKTGPSLEDFGAGSPVRWQDGLPHTEEIISTLFPPGALICVGQNQSHFKTVLMEPNVRLKLLRHLQFIVPSPMSARVGMSKEGKVSAHTLDNTAPRRFLVVEFDQGTLDEQSALLWHLSERERLVLAVHSGGKSVHGWFFAEGRTEQGLKEFMEYAVSLGADDATWTKSQFVRMPDGQRDNGKRQRVVYYDPQKLEAK
jgi:hypothetical protein